MTNRPAQQFFLPAVNLFRHLSRPQLIADSAADTDTSTTSSEVETADPLPKAEPEPSPPRRGWNWWLAGLILLGLVSGSAFGAFLLLTKLPPALDCQKISSMASDGDRLYCADVAAQSGKPEQLLAGIKTAQSLPKEHPLHAEGQRLIDKWSQDLVGIAKQKVERGDLSGATALVNRIPKSSEVYKRAQGTVKTWQEEWQQGQELTQKFQEAIKKQNWGSAWQQTDTMYDEMSFDYWRSSQREKLLKQLKAEKHEAKVLRQAQRMARYGSTGSLKRAIALAKKIQVGPVAKAQAQAEIKKWNLALQQKAKP
ncbi:MAG: hypothetical protein KME17_03765 [Cyanosarcina radialis HA8281-LM2]|nr:hypothetical protein [Cyanosarcina radialis HA8281-LM2]